MMAWKKLLSGGRKKLWEWQVKPLPSLFVWITLLMAGWSILHRNEASKRSFKGWAWKELFLEKLCFASQLGMRGKERVLSKVVFQWLARRCAMVRPQAVHKTEGDFTMSRRLVM